MEINERIQNDITGAWAILRYKPVGDLFFAEVGSPSCDTHEIGHDLARKAKSIRAARRWIEAR